MRRVWPMPPTGGEGPKERLSYPFTLILKFPIPCKHGLPYSDLLEGRREVSHRLFRGESTGRLDEPDEAVHLTKLVRAG